MKIEQINVFEIVKNLLNLSQKMFVLLSEIKKSTNNIAKLKVGKELKVLNNVRKPVAQNW